MSDCALALDLGTTHVKLGAFLANGSVFWMERRHCPALTSADGAYEVNPEIIWEAVQSLLAQFEQDQSTRNLVVHSLSFSAAMHSLIGIGPDDFTAVTSVFTWADRRAHAQAKLLRADVSARAIMGFTGTPLHAMSPLVKMVWLRETQPGLFEKVRRWVGIKEYVLSRWLREWLVDECVASATGLFELRKKIWHAPSLTLAGISAHQLPNVVEPHSRVGRLKILNQDVDLVIGGSDGVLATFGMVSDKHQAAMSIGTSGAIRKMSSQPLLASEAMLFSYVCQSHSYVVGGATNNGALVLQWLREQWFCEMPLPELIDAALSIPPGAEGLTFLACLTGERAPFWNESASGLMKGLRLHHSRAHVVRAALEGILFPLALILGEMEVDSNPTELVLTTGGFFRTLGCASLAADILGKPVQAFDSVDGSLYGACRMAGFFENAAKIHGPVCQPDPARSTIYKDLLREFTAIYKSNFSTLAFRWGE